tara:strand:- start:4296 stop:5372 length:1077 start_codon:yes stop_codon:yes gene_type:complete
MRLGAEMNPYKNLPDKYYWRTAVANKHFFDIDGIWNPKFKIEQKDIIVTFGSCFAQHIGRALEKKEFSWKSFERPPYGMTSNSQKSFNYDVFSARTGNIYTTSLLNQWTEWSLGQKPLPTLTWQQQERHYDPFRPVVENSGFADQIELYASRKTTISAFSNCITQADYFVFTLGLTESWFDRDSGLEYPMCPGTAAGTFNKDKHMFENQNFEKVKKILVNAISLMREANHRIKFILTVSPVPLTATNSGEHVLVATMKSKSILRAVAAQLTEEYDFVDYFPSYEIINSPVFRGAFFEPNLRSVNHIGVDFVMDTFFSGLTEKFGSYIHLKHNLLSDEKAEDDLLCEEELLDNAGTNQK